MSYCRWGYNSDLYIYEAEDGFICHVAARRRVWQSPPPEFPKNGDLKALTAWYEEYTSLLEDSQDFTPIQLQHAGETFSTDTAEEMAQVVEMLIAEGYLVPDYVIPSLREEQ
jgi:hypothetical protein